MAVALEAAAIGAPKAEHSDFADATQEASRMDPSLLSLSPTPTWGDPRRGEDTQQTACVRTIGFTGFAIALGLAGAVVTWYLAGRRGRSALLSVTLVVGLVAMAGLVATVVVAGIDFGLFSGMYLIYLVGVVSVPLLGLGALAAWWQRRPSRTLAALGVCLLVPALVGIYATHVAPYRLRDDRAALMVPADRVGSEGLRIAVLSDLQLSTVTDYERDALDEVMATEPDVIVIAGDLFQGSAADLDREVEPYREMLGGLSAPGGIYVVRGDVDGSSGQMERLVAGTDVQILDDEVARFEVDGTRVTLGGVRLDWRTKSARAVFTELEATAPHELAILLSHRPDTVLDLPPDSRVDLVAAGHTHGGQVALPGFGPITILSQVPRHVGAGGLHEVNENAIYVSSGIGMERGGAPEIRLWTRPSYGIIDVMAEGA